jgi:hypothetical protein
MHEGQHLKTVLAGCSASAVVSGVRTMSYNNNPESKPRIFLFFFDNSTSVEYSADRYSTNVEYL